MAEDFALEHRPMATDIVPPLATPPAEQPVGGVMHAMQRLYQWVLHWANTPHALVALALISFFESSCFLIPPDVLLLAMCLSEPRKGYRYALVCSVASVLGGVFGYFLGWWGWDWLAPLFFAYVPGFTPDIFAAVQARYLEMGVVIVFTAGFSPIPYKLFTIASGVMGMPLGSFILASAVSRSARFFLEAWLLRKFGAPVRGFIDRYFNWLALAGCVLLVGGFVAVKWLF